MRVLLDANVIISALLALAQPRHTVTRIVQAALRRSFDLLLPADVVDEVLAAVDLVPYIRARVDADEARIVVAALRAAAPELPPLSGAPPLLTRDPKDDYLVAYALAARADYLVTGDKDLLALAAGGFPFRILSPAAFLAVLEEAGLA